jgi:hypothetical protein
MRNFIAGVLLSAVLTAGGAWAYVAHLPPPPRPRLDTQQIRSHPVYLYDMKLLIDAGRESCYMLDQGNNQKRLLLRN